MVESANDTSANDILSYGLLLSYILVKSLIDLSKFSPIELNTTYNSQTLSITGYTLAGNKWYKKESIKSNHISRWT